MKACWCCGMAYSSTMNVCGLVELEEPCDLLSKKGKCKTRSIQLRKFGHCEGKVKNKSWGLKKNKLQIKKFKSVIKRLEYYDKKLKFLRLKKHALMKEWKDDLIEIVISDT